jgi:hypothetical protein
MLHVEDEINPNLGLAYHKIDGPFIRMPRNMSLSITANVGLKKIMNSLDACEKLRSTLLSRGDAKKVFSDYGTRPHYVCLGPQASRNSKTDCINSGTIYGLSFGYTLEIVGVDDATGRTLFPLYSRASSDKSSRSCEENCALQDFYILQLIASR